MRFAIPTADRVFVFTDYGLLIFKKNETLSESVILDKPVVDAGKYSWTVRINPYIDYTFSFLRW